MKGYILTIDQGTSSSKVILYGIDGRKAAEGTYPVTFIEDTGGFIEQDPFDILSSIIKGMKSVIRKSGINPSQVRAVALDNQGETVIPFGKDDLAPLYNAVSWQDGRGELFINRLREDSGLTGYIKSTTGLIPSSYFSASKMEWLVKNADGVKKAAEAGNLIMATSEVWLINKLVRKKRFLTDYSTASRTMLFNIKTLKWDERLLDLFNLDIESMPDIVPPLSDYGTTDPEVCAGIEAPVLVSMVDQQASLAGHRCFNRGEAKLTMGTGGFLQVNSGNDPENRSGSIIKSVFIGTPDTVTYLYEGQIYSVGSAVEWMKRNRLIEDYTDLRIEGDGDLSSLPFFIPALSGLSAPYWKSSPLGAFLGMGLQTTSADLVRSVLEGIAFRTVQIIRLIEKEADVEIKSLSVDGRVSRNTYILKTVSGITGKKIVKPENDDLTSLGCFFLALIRLGVVKDYGGIGGYGMNYVTIEEKSNTAVLERFGKWENLLQKIVDD